MFGSLSRLLQIFWFVAIVLHCVPSGLPTAPLRQRNSLLQAQLYRMRLRWVLDCQLETFRIALEHNPPGMDFDQREIESLGSSDRPDCLPLLKTASIDPRHFASRADQRSGKRQTQFLRCNLRSGLELLGLSRWLLLWFVSVSYTHLTLPTIYTV